MRSLGAWLSTSGTHAQGLPQSPPLWLLPLHLQAKLSIWPETHTPSPSPQSKRKPIRSVHVLVKLQMKESSIARQQHKGPSCTTLHTPSNKRFVVLLKLLQTSPNTTASCSKRGIEAQPLLAIHLRLFAKQLTSTKIIAISCFMRAPIFVSPVLRTCKHHKRFMLSLSHHTS